MKGKYFYQVVKLLRKYDDDFKQNEDVFARISDFIYNYAIQQDIPSVGVIAKYFVSKGFKERTIKLYVKAKNFKMAYYLCDKYNF